MGVGARCQAVAKGEAELSVQGISKNIIVEGTTLVGPLPKELQKFMTLSAGLAARSAAPEAAQAFVACLVRPSFKPKFAEQGLEQP